MAEVTPPDSAPPPAPPPPAGPPPPPPPWGSPTASGVTPYGWAPHAWAPHAAAAGSVGSGRYRAMNLGELLDAVFSLYRRNFLLIAAISAIVQVPFAVLAYVLYQVTDFAGLQSQLQNAEQSLTAPGQPASPDQVQSVLNAVGPVLLVSGLVSLVAIFIVLPLAEAATTRAVSDRYLDRPSSLGSSYAAAIRRLGALVVQSLILTAGFAGVFAAAFALMVLLAAALGPLAIPLILVVIAGLVVVAMTVYVRTSLAPPAIVLEHLSGWRGLARSWRLVGGLFWRLLGIRLLLVLITGVVGAVLVLILTLAGVALDANGRFILQQVASAITAVFVSPITYIAVTLLYYDARIRKEGFDIEMLAQAL